MDTKSRKHLSAKSLLAIVQKSFQEIPHQITGNRNDPITLSDCLMSAVAMFGIKSPSLLAFNDAYKNVPTIAHNLHTLYSIDKVPSDTYMRQRLDNVDPASLRDSFKQVFAQLQRGKVLEHFLFMRNSYLVVLDATGYFNSNKVSCDNCCVKNHRDGRKEYYHQMLGAVLVHPHSQQVIPFAPELILKEDNDSKNDCELNAAKRFIGHFRREHPHLNVIIAADSLYSNGPCIQELRSADMDFILNVKPGSHQALFEFVKDITKNVKKISIAGCKEEYSYVNGIPINDAHQDVLVNFLEYVETDSKGHQKHFSWVTTIKITEENIHKIVEGGRARWHIENQTFNTLKNQGYEFEHNFGHGYKQLSTVFANLLMLAFLIDQTQELCDALFQAALKAHTSRIRFWEKLTRFFYTFYINSWEELWGGMANKNMMYPHLKDSS